MLPPKGKFPKIRNVAISSNQNAQFGLRSVIAEVWHVRDESRGARRLLRHGRDAAARLRLHGARFFHSHHFLLCSFSAVSKRNFATKYAFCSIFQNLQNYLAEFLKKLQILRNFAKIRKIFLKLYLDFCKRSAAFCENR